MATPSSISLDVVIATYNRASLLERAIESLLSAAVPERMRVSIIVVDNNSKDNTRAVVEGFTLSTRGCVRILREARQGKSHALNCGIAASNADLIGCIDDDEEVDSHWFEVIERTFREKHIDFMGGPCVPRWGAEPPSWLPRAYCGVIGMIDCGPAVVPFGKDFPGMLTGGNCVLTRAVLQRVGPYPTEVGPRGSRKLVEEDHVMYERLLEVGARGLYVPDLVIHHYVPPERLTRRYYRSWVFWRGVSLGIIARRKRDPVVHFAGVPRHLFGSSWRGLLRMAASLIGRKYGAEEFFADELASWTLAGFCYGRWLFRTG